MLLGNRHAGYLNQTTWGPYVHSFDILIAFRVIQSCNFGLTFKHYYKLSLLIQFCNYEASYVSLSSYLSARLKEYEFLACNLDLDRV